MRLDFFGDTLEHIKAFDPETQRTGKIVQKLTLMPMSEVAFGEEAEKRFRRGYVETFGAATGEDPLYEAVSAGQRYPGMEHWLPLFHERLETLFDYVPDAPVSFDHLADEAVERAAGADRRPLRGAREGARDADLRRAALQAGAAGRHVPHARGVERAARRPHRAPHDALRGGRATRRRARLRSFGGRVGRNFAAERAAARASTCSMRRPPTCARCRARASG